jgi:hypothetical protein
MLAGIGRDRKSNGEVTMLKKGLAAIAGWLLLGGAPAANAEPAAPVTYVVMSLIGDNLTIVNPEQGQTGSRLDQNRHYDIPIKENTFDAAALNAVVDSVKKIQPDAAQEVLQTRNATLYRLQDGIFEGSAAGKGIRSSLQRLLKEHNATYFIIVTKHRAAAQIQLGNRMTGTGFLEGLGFYIDPRMRLTDSANGERGLGLIAPYAYVDLRLIDAKTMEVLREVPVAHARALQKMGSLDFESRAWDQMSDEQRVRIVRTLIRQTIDEAMPKMLTLNG